MKITSVVITLIIAATAVWGATLKSREHHGANQTSGAGAGTHAGISMTHSRVHTFFNFSTRFVHNRFVACLSNTL